MNKISRQKMSKKTIVYKELDIIILSVQTFTLISLIKILRIYWSNFIK